MKNLQDYPKGSLTVMAYFKAVSEYKKDVERITKILVEKVKTTEKGNLIYEASWSVNELDCIVFHEVFENSQAFEIHKETAHFKQWGIDTKGMCKPDGKIFVLENDKLF
ncbi:putative quinol monooxygenase [Ancylomarina sp.]|uniref:putative quinol monooxygenase n=1 Tax=Ancylomarina sp. TaxID=1970196 RepID=UPI003567C09B